MNGQPGFLLFPIRGKVVPERKQRLFSYLGIVTQAVETHMKEIGMRDVRRMGPCLISFAGSRGTLFLKSDFGLEENIDKGMIVIRTEGSAIAASYYLGFIGRFSLRWFVPVGLITLLAFFETGLRLLILPFLAAALIIPLAATVFIIRWGMNKELTRAFQIAENMIESGSGTGKMPAKETGTTLQELRTS